MCFVQWIFWFGTIDHCMVNSYNVVLINNSELIIFILASIRPYLMQSKSVQVKIIVNTIWTGVPILYTNLKQLLIVIAWLQNCWVLKWSWSRRPGPHRIFQMIAIAWSRSLEYLLWSMIALLAFKSVLNCHFSLRLRSKKYNLPLF